MRIRRLIGGLMAVLAALAGTVAGAAGPAAGDHGRRTVTFAIPGDQVFPEGVAADPARGVFFVSSTTDGTIYRGRLGSSSLEAFLPGGADGRTSATGLRVDRLGRLYVSGAATGQMWVYDTRTRALIRHFDTGLRTGTFINDVTFDGAGNAYFTDSMTPVLWRVPLAAVRPGAGVGEPERFINFDGTVVRYQPGFNLNGIATEPGGRSLLTVHSATGQLFRIPLGSRVPAEVAVQGGSLTTGDGLVTLGRKLLVVRHVETPTERIEAVVTVDIRGNSGRVVNSYTDDTFGWPTTAAVARDRLLVVNSQFDRRNAGLPPELPFTVSGVSLPRVLF